MKSICSEAALPPTVLPYPKLMRCTSRAWKGIVLFSRPGDGTVVWASSEDGWTLGHHSTEWAMNTFIDLPPATTVTLSN